MPIRFIHTADFHLGYQQYGSNERFNDFGRVFLYIVEQAVERDVDFVLLAGDLFHKRKVEPLASRDLAALVPGYLGFAWQGLIGQFL